jgi:hypothetical protein
MTQLLDTFRQFLTWPLARGQAVVDADPLIYRLRGWPDLPQRFRRAGVYQLLSTMTVRAVNRRWMQWKAQLSAEQVEDLIREVERQGLLHATMLRPRSVGGRPAVVPLAA